MQIKVAVVYGGTSLEHEVSLRSAEAVMDNLQKDKYTPVPIFVDRDGRWYADVIGGRTPVTVRLNASRELVTESGGVLIHTIDVAVPLVHGRGGDDGAMQGLFQLAAIPFVGSTVGVLNSCFDKTLTKALLRLHGFRCAEYLIFFRRNIQEDPSRAFAQVEEKIGYPCFVKPARSGSSIGACLVHAPLELPDALKEAFKYDEKVLVEPALLHARELEVAVLGSDPPIVTGVGEVTYATEYLSFEAKYHDPRSKAIVPARIEPELRDYLKREAERIFIALECKGVARIDFLVPKGEDPYVLEVEGMPAMTAKSMVPSLFKDIGVSYGDLLDRLITLSLSTVEKTAIGKGEV